MNNTLNEQAIKADLHIHSPYSKCYKGQQKDTKRFLSELREQALFSGFQLLAITDHHSCQIADLVAGYSDNKLTITCGMELSVDYHGVTDKVSLLLLYRPGVLPKWRETLLALGLTSADFGNGQQRIACSLEQVCALSRASGAILLSAHQDKTPERRQIIPHLHQQLDIDLFDLKYGQNHDLLPAGTHAYTFSDIHTLTKFGTTYSQLPPCDPLREALLGVAQK